MCHFLNLYVSYAHTLLSPRVQQMLADIAGDEIYGQLRVDFCGLDGRMPHHHLKHLLGHAFAKDDGTGEGMAGHAGFSNFPIIS